MLSLLPESNNHGRKIRSPSQAEDRSSSNPSSGRAWMRVAEIDQPVASRVEATSANRPNTSAARQREFYNIYLKLYQALMTSIKVHERPSGIIKAAVVKMDAILASYKFTDDKIRAAATAFVENYRKSRANSLGHTVGMEVHDVRNPTATLEPGQIFTIEPGMQIPDEHLGILLEDMLLITDSGFDNLSAFVPVEIHEIEKLMAKHRGLSDAMGH